MSVVGQVIGQAVTLDDVVAAAERIKPLAHKTAVQTSRLFDEAAGVKAHFKCENLQRGGSFKIRGAMNFLMSLSESERKRGVVTFSSGNHAQAVAMAAAHLGVAATIVMPTDAPKAKLESTMAYGPEDCFLRSGNERTARKSPAGSRRDRRGCSAFIRSSVDYCRAGHGGARAAAG